MNKSSAVGPTLVGAFLGAFLGVVVGLLFLDSLGEVFNSHVAVVQSSVVVTNTPTAEPVVLTSALAPTLMPHAVLATQSIVTANLNLSKTYSTVVPGALTSRTPVSATVELRYLRLQGDRLMLYVTASTNQCLSFRPDFVNRDRDHLDSLIIKNGYLGSPKVIERGGFYLLSQVCEMHGDAGWLIYQVDLTTFSLSGLYTLDLNAVIQLEGTLVTSGDFPLITFEVQ